MFSEEKGGKMMQFQKKKTPGSIFIRRDYGFKCFAYLKVILTFC